MFAIAKDENLDKNIDESWKEQAEKEKENLKDQEEFTPPEADFKFFVTTLAIQASIFMGVIVNPATNQKEENLPQAKFIIDTMDMLKEKTKGNLDKEEETLIDNVLYELRMQYVEKNKGETK
ncbi:MAG: DUF1844 domain-containing protein [Candidatus Omnitrophica bacterium]|nr:DUF1844 domain-containing protein [Candidatus Omnitrophota bacterium]